MQAGRGLRRSWGEAGTVWGRETGSRMPGHERRAISPEMVKCHWLGMEGNTSKDHSG